MLRSIGVLACRGAAAFPFIKVSDDADHVKTERPSYMLEPTGVERLRAMFEIDEFGGISDQLNSVLQCSFMSAFVGGMYGGVLQSRMAYTNFMDNNQATIFTTNMDAKKKLQDAITVAFGKGAFRVAWRLSLFSGMFAMATTLLITYEGKSKVWHFAGGAATAGALYKFNLGPRAMIVGGTLGGVLGIFCGAMTTLLLDLSGHSMEEVYFWQHTLRKQRMAAQMRAYGTLNEFSAHPLIDNHDSNLKKEEEEEEEVRPGEKEEKA